MSEIVRPTRDGIHGREYISTQVDLGRKWMSLEFDDGETCFRRRSPWWKFLAHYFRSPALVAPRERINHTLLRGARGIGSFAVIPSRNGSPA